MAKIPTNINRAQWQERELPRGDIWRYLDLSGNHLGARIEDLVPGDASSVHHFHTLEEEHVLALDGAATLIFGTEEIPLQAGDHVWFAAGEEVAHHIVNRENQPFRFLVFGERRKGDVVFYPERGTMLVKANEVRRYHYEPHQPDDD